MQVEVEKLEGLGRKLKVVLPSERVEQAYRERLQEVAKKTRLPGFRPGKAPLQVIESRIGKSLRREVVGELMQSGFQQAVIDNKLKIAGSPEVKGGEINKDEPLEFEVLFEAYPEIELVDPANISLQKPVASISEVDIEKALQKLQRQHAQWNEVERAAQPGDQVLIDFEGFIEKKPFPGGSAKQFILEIGSHQMVPGFEEQLVGAMPKSELDINVTFPESYPLANLANQAVLFKVTVREVREPQLPLLDDKFVEKVDIKDVTSLEALKVKVQESLQHELEHHLRTLLKKQVLDKLLESNSIEVPQSMVNDEIKHLQDLTRQQITVQQGRKVDPGRIELPSEPYLVPAKRRVSLGLLIAELIKQYGIKVDREKAQRRVTQMVAHFPHAEEMANYYLNNKRLMAEIEAAVLEDQVVDKLLQLMQIEEKPLTFEEVMEQVRQIGE